MSLRESVKSWPEFWATCPIYKKGVTLPNGSEACGKSPLGKAHHENMTPAESLLHVESNPDKFGAIGVFTGPDSNGLVIVDVDANLTALREKYKPSLNVGNDAVTPYVKSPKQFAAKFLFYVPEELWLDVAGLSLSATNEGFEVLWGRQGVCTGDYSKGGQYDFFGDPEDIAIAPAWLIALMKKQKKLNDERDNAKPVIDQRYAHRTFEQRLEIVRCCLGAIPAPGRGSEELWWRIGAMVHSADLGEEGLDLWRKWSKKDAEYADDWLNGKDPCANKWGDYKPGALTIGSLVTLADHYDPERRRLQRNATAAEAIKDAETMPLSLRQSYLNGTELLKRAKELEDSIENPALLDQEKHLLALEGGRRDTAAIDRLLDADLSYERTGAGGPKRVAELDSTAFEYLIPGLLPKPWTLLIHADGGTGKTAMCQTIAKHISRGKAFNIHGGLVDVPVGKVLWLNGDQNERILRRQFMMIDAGDNIDVVGEWDMQWYRRFCKYQKANKYDLVVIDSLDGCNDANPYEENKREFALPLKRLARRNGQDFPACTIIVIHHNTKEGKFRGTSAIRAAVDETWNMKRATQNEILEFELGPQSRIVEVEKSRDDREGQRLVFRLLQDFTYLIGHMKRSETRVQTPNDHTLDILQLMRENAGPWSRVDLRNNENVGGEHRDRAIKYGLQRLEQQGLVERCDPPVEKRGKGKPPVYYRAVGTNVPGTTEKREVEVLPPDSVSKIENDCAGTDLKDNGQIVQNEIVQNKSSSTPVEMCTTETDVVILDKVDFGQSDVVLKNDCAGTDLNLDTNPWVNKEIDQNLWND